MEASDSTLKHWCGQQECLGGLRVASGPVYILLILFNSMLEVIVAVIQRNPINVSSGCFNFYYGSCTSLYIIDISRD